MDILGSRCVTVRTVSVDINSFDLNHQNGSCIKTGSDESHFNVSLTVRDKVTRQCPQTTNIEERGEMKRNRTEVLLLTTLSNAFPLGQPGSPELAVH